jgi:hypothetical protein
MHKPGKNEYDYFFKLSYPALCFSRINVTAGDCYRREKSGPGTSHAGGLPPITGWSLGALFLLQRIINAAQEENF